jgi:protoporphyrinogen oxidase
METPVVGIHHSGGRATGVTLRHDGQDRLEPASHVISSMPMHHLVAALDPPPPAEVLAAGRDLHYRDYLTVALVVPEERSFPDNWIYIHATDVEVGRIQNYGSWSPFMVKDGRTCLGLEYFVFEGDALWNAPDEELIALATRELDHLGLAKAADVEAGYVVRVPKAYPYYDFEYRENVATICRWLDEHAPNVHPVGRNGMHKYNNQDHSMYTAMLTVENILGEASHDIWAVNVEEEYHEESSSGSGSGSSSGSSDSSSAALREGTGRDAPVLPRRTAATGA